MSNNVTQEFQTSALGELITSPLSPQLQITFEYTVTNSELTVTTTTAGGTVTQSTALAVVRTSTTTASKAHFESKRRAKYRAGLGGLARFSALFTTPVSSTEQLIGLADEEGSTQPLKNGLTIGYLGTTFGLHRFVNDTVVTTALSAWDDALDGSGPSGMTADFTKLNVFAIQFSHGSGQITVLIEYDGVLIPVHKVDYANTATTPASYNANYRIMAHVDNLGTTSDLTIKTGSWAYFVQGQTELIELQQPLFASGEKQKTTVTTEIALFTIRNKTTYASKTNLLDAVLTEIGCSIEASTANNLGKIRIVRGATLGGTPSYADIDATDSIMEIDTAGTTVSSGTELLSIPLAGKNDKDSISLLKHKFIIAPGETLTVAGTSANSATINGNLSWRELF